MTKLNRNQPQIQSSFQRINNYCISYSKSISKLKCLGNRIPDDNDFESLDKFSIVSLVIHNSITLNFSRYLSFYFLGNRLVIDVKFIFGMFWNLSQRKLMKFFNTSIFPSFSTSSLSIQLIPLKIKLIMNLKLNNNIIIIL